MLVTLRDDDVAQSCTALQFATGQTGDVVTTPGRSILYATNELLRITSVSLLSFEGGG